MSECDSSEFEPVSYGVDTVIGNIIGLKVTETYAAAITVVTFMIIFICFLIVYPICVGIDMKVQGFIIQNLSSFIKGFPKMERYLDVFCLRPFKFLIGIRPAITIYIIIIGMFIGVFIRLTGLNCALQNELMSLNIEIFIVLFIPPLFIKSTFMGTKHKVFFHNFILVFFHHYVLVFLHALGGFFVCFGLAFVLYYSLFGKYSFLELLLLSSLMAGISPGSVLGALQGMKANFRVVDILQTESMLSTPIAIMFYGIFLSLLLGTQDADTTHSDLVGSYIGLALIRLIYMVSSGLIIGVVSGFIGCLFLKLTYPKRLRLFQPLVVYLFMFLSFFIAFLVNSHGILSMIPCSMFMARYSHFAMSATSREYTENILALFASTAGQFVYLYVGIAFVESLYSHFHFDVVLILLVNVLVVFFRIVYIVTVDFCWNIGFRIFQTKTHKSIIPRTEIFIHAFSGLKGALPFIFAFILPPTLEKKNLFLTTSLMVVIPSLFIQGSVMLSILKILKIKKRKMSIRDKLVLCRNMIDTLEKVKLFIPHVRMKEHLKYLLARSANKNFKKFQGFTAAYYENTLYEKEVREKHGLWPKSQVDVGIMYRCFNLLESVFHWSKAATGGKPSLINIDPEMGVDDEDVEKANLLKKEFDEISRKIGKRLAGLMKLKQYGDNIIKIPEEKYVLKIKEYGHVPVALSPEFVHKHGTSSLPRESLFWKFVRSLLSKIIALWDMVDLTIQRIVNIGSISTKERIFLISEFWYRKFQTVSGEMDEELEFLEEVVSIVPRSEEKSDGVDNLLEEESEEEENGMEVLLTLHEDNNNGTRQLNL